MDRYDEIPPNTLRSLNNFIMDGCPHGGSFISSVLENDLKGCVSNGDDNNLEMLAVIVKYMFNRAPMGCWGTKEKVKQWVASGGMHQFVSEIVDDRKKQLVLI